MNSLSYLASRCTLMVIMQKHLIAQRYWLIRIKYSRGQWNKASVCEDKNRCYTHTMALTPRQYRSHMLLNRGCPPISQIYAKTGQGDIMEGTGNQILYLWCISFALKSLYIWIQDNQSWGRRMICVDETYFYCYVAFGDFPHVEADCRDHVFIELTRLVQKKHADHFNHINKTNLLVKGCKG